MTLSHRATRANINLDHLSHNLMLIQKHVGEDFPICLAVKANGYGHGAVEIARHALKKGVQQLAVSNVDEGIELRNAGIEVPILLLGYAVPQEFPDLFEAKLQPFIGDLDYALSLEEAFSNLEAADALNIHLKVDTGMGRLGCAPEDAKQLAMRIHSSTALNLMGLCTHFPCSDSFEASDIEFTSQQVDKMKALHKDLEKSLDKKILLHTANSAGALLHKESHFNMVRIGISAYGYGLTPSDFPEKLKPVMEVKSRIAYIKKIPPNQGISYGRTWVSQKESFIATIPMGYGDGLPRLLSNKGRVLINGKSYPMVGNICMDQFMVDLGASLESSEGSTELKAGDEVLIFGWDPAGMNAEEIGNKIGTISYEICCGIAARVIRYYS